MNQSPPDEQIDAPGPGAAEAATEDAATQIATTQIAALEDALAEMQERHARAIADYQNLRRRSEEGRLELARQTVSGLVRDFLPLVDDLGRALESVPGDIREHPWVAGVEMVRRKVLGTLEGYGVREIAATGQPFDPARHEAIGYGPGPRDQVVLVAEPGYVIADSLVRPARVIVGDGSGAESHSE